MMLQIRNMESDRCIDKVKNELCRLGFQFRSVELGKAELKSNLSADQISMVDKALRNSGLELIEDKKNHIIEKIKAAISRLIYLTDEQIKIRLSDYLIKSVNFDYAYLSNLFSEMEGITIEKYYILQKIERVKELLVSGKFSLSDIAFKLQYSSVSHLSNQFKKVTGIAPSIFTRRRSNRRIK
jgi:AraC-like DNA-binding protein